jgi:hypothetical protein
LIEGHALKPLIFIARSTETSQPDGDRIDKDVFFLGTWETTATGHSCGIDHRT